MCASCTCFWIVEVLLGYGLYDLLNCLYPSSGSEIPVFKLRRIILVLQYFGYIFWKIVDGSQLLDTKPFFVAVTYPSNCCQTSIYARSQLKSVTFMVRQSYCCLCPAIACNVLVCFIVPIWQVATMKLYQVYMSLYSFVESTLTRWSGSPSLKTRVAIPVLSVSLTSKFNNAGQAFLANKVSYFSLILSIMKIV